MPTTIMVMSGEWCDIDDVPVPPDDQSIAFLSGYSLCLETNIPDIWTRALS
jgi:hypothetical protein